MKVKITLWSLTCLFFMWGFLRSMTDIIIPYFRKAFDLNYTRSMLVQFSFLGAYFLGSVTYYLVSYFYGDPIQRVGYKKAILFGVCLSVVGCALFLPAAGIHSYFMFLMALLVLGLGFTTLEITANAFVSFLGSPDTASARLNLTQAFNALGTTLAPLLGGYMIFTLWADKAGQPQSRAIEYAYLIFGSVFLILGIILLLLKFPVTGKTGLVAIREQGALKFAQLKLGIPAIFFYNGAETGIGSFMIMLMEQHYSLPATLSKRYLSLYWGGAMLGRFIAPVAFNKNMASGKRLLIMLAVAAAVGAFLFTIVHLPLYEFSFFALFVGVNLCGFLIARRSASFTLGVFAFAAIMLLLTGVLGHGHWGFYCFIAIGLFNSVMFSNIYTLSIHGLGKYTSQGSSLLIMAILGGGVLSLVQGVLADKIGIRLAYLLHVLSYGYLSFFGFYCYNKLKIK